MVNFWIWCYQFSTHLAKGEFSNYHLITSVKKKFILIFFSRTTAYSVTILVTNVLQLSCRSVITFWNNLNFKMAALGFDWLRQNQILLNVCNDNHHTRCKCLYLVVQQSKSDNSISHHGFWLAVEVTWAILVI